MNTSICLSFVSAPALRWKNIMKGCLSDLMGSRNTHIKIPSQLCGGVGTGSSIRSEFPINMQRKDGGWLLSWSCLCFEELDMKFSTGACGMWSWHRQDCDLAVGLKPCLNSGFWCLTMSRTVLVNTWSYWFVSVSSNWGNNKCQETRISQLKRKEKNHVPLYKERVETVLLSECDISVV